MRRIADASFLLALTAWVGALWAQGDWVSKGTLIIMLLMSMGSWYIIFTKLFEQHKLMKAAEEAGKNFWTAGSVRGGQRGVRHRQRDHGEGSRDRGGRQTPFETRSNVHHCGPSPTV